jgi:hypothetical protein
VGFYGGDAWTLLASSVSIRMAAHVRALVRPVCVRCACCCMQVDVMTDAGDLDGPVVSCVVGAASHVTPLPPDDDELWAPPTLGRGVAPYTMTMTILRPSMGLFRQAIMSSWPSGITGGCRGGVKHKPSHTMTMDGRGRGLAGDGEVEGRREGGRYDAFVISLDARVCPTKVNQLAATIYEGSRHAPARTRNAVTAYGVRIDR